jgi:hypothetical protein
MFERLALPVADPALLAAVLFEPLGKKSEFEVMPACPTANDEQVFDRDGPRARYDVASLFGLVPASEIEAEPPRAFTD